MVLTTAEAAAQNSKRPATSDRTLRAASTVGVYDVGWMPHHTNIGKMRIHHSGQAMPSSRGSEAPQIEAPPCSTMIA
jgi:hypothetical protein